MGSTKALILSITSSIFKVLGSLIVLLVISKQCTLNLVGQFGYLIVITNLISMLIDFGFAQSAIKYMDTVESARRSNNAIFWTKLSLTLPIIVIYFLGLLGKTECLFFISSFFLSWGSDLFIRRRLLLEFFAEAALNVIYTFVIISCVVFLDEITLFGLAKIYFLIRLLYLIFSLVINGSAVRISLPDFEKMTLILKKSWPYFLQIFVASCIVSVDTLIVGHFDNLNAVGFYQFVAKLLVISSVLVAAIQNYKFSHYVRLQETGMLKIEELRKDSKVFFMLGIFLCMLVFCTSKVFSIISRETLFFSATIYATVFLISIGRNVILPFGVYLSISGMQKKKLLYNVLGLMVQIVVSVSFYNSIGINAVLFGMLAGYSVTYSLYYYRTLIDINVS